MCAEERLHVGPAADEAFAVVGPPEDLVNQVQERPFARGAEVVEQGFEALDLGVEVREAVGDRAGDWDGGEKLQRWACRRALRKLCIDFLKN